MLSHTKVHYDRGPEQKIQKKGMQKTHKEKSPNPKKGAKWHGND